LRRGIKMDGKRSIRKLGDVIPGGYFVEEIIHLRGIGQSCPCGGNFFLVVFDTGGKYRQCQECGKVRGPI